MNQLRAVLPRALFTMHRRAARLKCTYVHARVHALIIGARSGVRACAVGGRAATCIRGKVNIEKLFTTYGMTVYNSR